jgi:ABC-type branched-subunit amino acid transport system ATPase component/branched-subunit amino acid ABC-type transport system permease component
VLAFIIAGLVSGSVYGLIGLGVVVTYRTSGVFNFAYGALATVAAYVYYFLHVQHGVSVVITIALCLLVLAPAMGVSLERLASRIAGVGLSLQIAATVGLVLIIEALGNLLFGPAELEFPAFLPQGTFGLAGARVGWDQLIIFICSLAAAVGLWGLLRRARIGKAMLAVVDNPELLDLAGTSPSFVRRWAWIISCMLVTFSGLVLAPSVGLTPETLTLLVIQGFGAAAIGAFRNIWLTWVGGLVVGVGASILTEEVSSSGTILSGLAPSLPFIVLFLVILVMPRSRLVARSALRTTRSLNPPWTLPGQMQVGIGAAVLAFLCVVPAFAGFRVDGWTTSLVYAMLLLSLGILVRDSGQVSLCQVTFAAIGVTAFSKFSVDLGLPWLISLILAGLVAVPIGALLAIPAIRVSGLYLALATFGFGLLVQNMFYQTNVMFGATNAGLSVPAPSLANGVDQSNIVYYVVLAIALVVTVGVVVLSRSRLGRLLRAMSDSPVALSAQGANVAAARVLVFCIAAFIAAIAGSLLGVVQSEVTGLSYDPQLSLELLTLIVITVGGVPWYALIAAVGLGVIPTYLTNGNVTYYLQIIFGVFAVLVAVTKPARLPAKWRHALDASLRQSPRGLSVRLAQDSAKTLPAHLRAAGESFAVTGLEVRFGGLRAVDDVTFAARPGEVVGLIGPNGAGKSTSFNACTGLVKPASGSIKLGDRELSRLGSSQRARLGLGRTFQQMELFESMTVAQNVAMGREALYAGGNPVSQILSKPSERQEVAVRAVQAIKLCGLEEHANITARDLSTGQRRLVEMARCLAGPFEVLLLDEPSSGLDRQETERFGQILGRVTRDWGVGVLLVEHDMSLVMDVCSYIYVLDFGKLIFEGTPSEVRASSVVQAAYLGSADVERDLLTGA